MAVLVKRLRVLCSTCILAPQNRNCGDGELQPYCTTCSDKWVAADEIERLQAIVGLLPKDAEGNPLFVGMRRWVSDEDSRGPFQGWETITQLRQRPNGEWEVFCKTCDTTQECCWSSMEAAEKARQPNG